MSGRGRAFWPLACVGCFVAGLLAGGLWLRSAVADPPAPKPPIFPMDHRLGANYYQMTAGEYRACCLTVYRAGTDRLVATLAANKPPRPAVVMDLDETVLDNSSFQTYLYRNGLEYSDDLWAKYEDLGVNDVRLVPGAQAFIDRAEELGVTVVYISNRDEKHRNGTIAVLRKLGLLNHPIEGRLFLKEKTSDKTARRDAVTAKYNVLQYYGDNLRDFAEAFAAPAFKPEDGMKVRQEALKARDALVREAEVHWGIDWFVLPNPVYGEWEKFLGSDPKALLTPSNLPKP